MKMLLLAVLSTLLTTAAMAQDPTEWWEKDGVDLYRAVSVTDPVDTYTYSVHNRRDFTVCVWIWVDETISHGYQSRLTQAIVPRRQWGSLGGVALFAPPAGSPDNEFSIDWFWLREGHIDCPE